MIPGSDAWNERVAQLAAETRPGYYWLSFADEEGFRGVAIIHAPNRILAITRTHELGINPGGQVQVIGPAPEGAYKQTHVNRLLNRDEAMDAEEEP